MVEIFKFPIKKSGIEGVPKSSPIESFEEKTAINRLDMERYHLLLNLKRNNPINRNSDTYKRDYTELKKNSKVFIVEILNNASESDINKNRKYYMAAFNIILE
jgi:hypothetical protein